MTFAAGQPINVEDFVDNPAPFFSIESSDGTTHSLTTVANQKVMVLALVNTDFGSVQRTISLQYDGVTKQSMTAQGDTGDEHSYTLGYEEIPGAGTANITVDPGGGSVLSCRIFVFKLRVG